MLTGRMAFPYSERENPLLIVTRILNGPRPVAPRAVDGLAPELAARPDLIDALDAQLGRALSADPEGPASLGHECWAAIEPLLRAVNEPRPGTTRLLTRSGAPVRERPSTRRPAGSAEPAPDAVSPPAATRRPRRLVRRRPRPASPGRRCHRRTAAQRRPRTPRRGHGASRAGRCRQKCSRGGVLPGGDSVVAVGPDGLARWERGNWAGFAPPAGIGPPLACAASSG